MHGIPLYLYVPEWESGLCVCASRAIERRLHANFSSLPFSLCRTQNGERNVSRTYDAKGGTGSATVPRKGPAGLAHVCTIGCVVPSQFSALEDSPQLLIPTQDGQERQSWQEPKGQVLSPGQGDWWEAGRGRKEFATLETDTGESNRDRRRWWFRVVQEKHM